VERFEPVPVRQAISPASAIKLKDILTSVTDKDGTGFNAALEGYKVCGKTGTAQKTDESGRYAKGRYISSFVGFVPAENPEVAILVMVDEPTRNHYGGIVSAPAFKKIAQETLTYMNVQPKNREAGKLRVSREGRVLG
jgi:cell division protein FtsI (penicillin-binding protein 3)